MITHITSKREWDKAQERGIYKTSSLDKDGFIHCSKMDQVIEVANYLFKGRQNLVLLCIEEEKVGSEIKYEDLYQAGDEYPHIYGPLDIEAVAAVYDFPTNEDGLFNLPLELRT